MTNLPTGTVTFLFTDIEGSTQLAREHPNRWEALRARHDAILRAAIETNSGYLFQIIGDAFCAAFHTSGDALNAAIKSQTDLRVENWGDVPVRVRMGIHTGKADLQENGQYVGHMTLGRVQRLMSAGHGGQALVSPATEQLVRDELPEGVELRDLGERLLKDLIRPEHIYQIVATNLPVDFPPLRTLDAYRHNLPAQLTTFIGREKEMAEVKQAIHENRLVTLTGSGGTGKTRLAIQAGADSLDQFPDGVWLVQLGSTAEADLVPRSVAGAVGVQEIPTQSLTDTLAHFLSSKSLLLVLDSCEHLIEACARLAEHLLQACPDVRILATSRERLRIPGEVTRQVALLTVPDPRRLPPLEELEQYEAVRLFVERGRSVMPSFELTKKNAGAVAQLCFHLDGMPLALELAAALLNVLTAEQILSRLGDRFQLLTRGNRAALDRQQTLQATLDWSYNLLSEQEQLMFKRLAVFVSGWTLEAAETICSGEEIDPGAVLHLLSQLVNKSLVTAAPVGEESRYKMLETIRQYALERLGESGKANEVRGRHLGYFLQWVEKAAPLGRAEQFAWSDRFEAEHDNIRAALEWSRVAIPGANAGLRLAAAMGYFWKLRGYYTEGRMRLSAALAQRGAQQPTLARAQALHQASVLAFFQSDYQAVRASAEESMVISRGLGAVGRLTVANTLEILAEAATETGDYSTAPKLYEEALAVYREVGDLVGIGDTLKMLGWVSMRTGDFEQAESRLGEGLVACRQSGDLRQINSALAGLGELAVRRGRYERARDLLGESLDISRRSGDKWGLAIALGSLGWIALRQQDFGEMGKLLGESMKVRLETGDKGGIAWCLEKLAEAAGRQGQPEKAVKTFSAASVLRTSVGSVIDPVDQQDHDRILSGLRTALGEEVFRGAWEQGAAMPLDEMIAYALSEPGLTAREATRSEKEQFGGLTAREREVATLIAQGKSNREIAATMVVGAKTVETYVTRILNKLGLVSRVQIAIWAKDKGLAPLGSLAKD
jgi:predicted ATPase/class 3 adenylate cyclase/DNA-binding CsgD family transcriptional regulator